MGIANANSGDYSSCEYSASETSRLATAVAEKEMDRFATTTWTCGAVCGGSGDSPAFDLIMAEQVGPLCIDLSCESSIMIAFANHLY